MKGMRLLSMALIMVLFLTSTAFAEGSQLKTVHIYNALWQGAPQLPPETQFSSFDFAVLTEENIGGEDIVFKDRAGSEFTLMATGQSNVKAMISGGFSARQGSGFYFNLEGNATLAPNVPYQLIAPSNSNDYKWVVESGVYVMKGDGNNTYNSNKQSYPTQYPQQSSPSSDPTQYGSDIDPNYNNAGTQLFADVNSGFWAYNFIKDLTTRHVLEGYPDGKFRPDRIVTRAEFAKIMVLAAGLSPTRVTSTSFSDIDTTDWEAPYVEAAKAYLNGYSLPDGRVIYNPDAPALREDIAVAVVKLKGYDKTRLPDRSIIQAMFKDYDSISDFAKDYVALAVDNKLVSGYPDETFRAQKPITRAEAAAMLWKAYQYGNDNKDAPYIKVEVPATPTPPSTVTDSVYKSVYGGVYESR